MTRDDARLIQTLLAHTIKVMPPADSDEAKAAREAAAKLAQTSHLILDKDQKKVSEDDVRKAWSVGPDADQVGKSEIKKKA
jgi:hypothetical protein